MVQISGMSYFSRRNLNMTVQIIITRGVVRTKNLLVIKRQCGRGGVMMFGAIISDGFIYLEDIQGNLNSEKYKEILLNLYVKTNFDGNCYLFQQDNCSIHTSKSVQEFLMDNDITTIP